MVVPLSSGTVIRVGFIGKLPAHGDFVQRGIAVGTAVLLDAWLSAMIENWRLQAGADFEMAYAEAGPLCLVVGRGEQRHVAALAASMDRVGRLFPLLAVGAVAPSGAELALAWRLHEAIADVWDADALASALATPIESEPDCVSIEGEWRLAHAEAAPWLLEVVAAAPPVIPMLWEAFA